MHTSSHPSIMSTSFMSPITPLEVSRAAATHCAASSSALPLPSLSSWSLDHSCTTFKIAKAAGTIATATATTTDTNTATSTNTPRHPQSTRLLEDDPDRDEEAHIRSFKRNRNQGMTLSPATPSKRRCYPMMLRLLGNNPNSGATMKSDHCDFGTKRWPNNNYYNQQQGFASLTFRPTRPKTTTAMMPKSFFHQYCRDDHRSGRPSRLPSTRAKVMTTTAIPPRVLPTAKPTNFPKLAEATRTTKIAFVLLPQCYHNSVEILPFEILPIWPLPSKNSAKAW